MAKSKKGDVVKVHYTGKLSDGTVFDSSKDREPLSFNLGKNEVIAGFENAILGMEEGQSKSITIASDEAYGDYKKNLVLPVSRDKIPSDIKPEVGMQLESVQPDGKRIPVTIIKVDDENVTLDANHPLAGQDLHFDIELVEIQKVA